MLWGEGSHQSLRGGFRLWSTDRPKGSQPTTSHNTKMPQRSSAPGGGSKKKKGRAPAHQNSYAFRHNPKSKKTEKILSSPNVGVCRRCHEKIEWRKKYRKVRDDRAECDVMECMVLSYEWLREQISVHVFLLVCWCSDVYRRPSPAITWHLFCQLIQILLACNYLFSTNRELSLASATSALRKG